MGDYSVTLGRLIFFEELFLHFFEEGDGDSCFVLGNNKKRTDESTMTRNTNPYLV